MVWRFKREEEDLAQQQGYVHLGSSDSDLDLGPRGLVGSGRS